VHLSLVRAANGPFLGAAHQAADAFTTRNYGVPRIKTTFEIRSIKVIRCGAIKIKNSITATPTANNIRLKTDHLGTKASAHRSAAEILFMGACSLTE
jgi:hypothetical protein